MFEVDILILAIEHRVDLLVGVTLCTIRTDVVVDDIPKSLATNLLNLSFAISRSPATSACSFHFPSTHAVLLTHNFVIYALGA